MAGPSPMILCPAGVLHLAATDPDTSRETTPLTGGRVYCSWLSWRRVALRLSCLSCSLSGCPRAKKSGIKILHKEDKDEQEPIK